LLRRRGRASYNAFDLLWLDGRDLRALSLIERKRLLPSIVPAQPSVTLYADHIERSGAVRRTSRDVRKETGGLRAN
jgi:bifunctional non-homologous end joining protein LigD